MATAETNAHETVLTPNTYMQHHLQNLVLGKLPAGYERADGEVLEHETWTLAHSPAESKAMGFWSYNIDTLGWSIFLGMLFCFFFHRVARKSVDGAPSGFHNLIEMCLEFVNKNVKDAFSGTSNVIGPLALTVFI